MHYLAAAVMAGIYIYNMPVAIAFIWKKHRFAAGVGAFSAGAAVKRAMKQLESGAPRKKVKFKRVKRAVYIVFRLIRSVELEHVSARLLVGAGDAADTAKLCGGLIALAKLLRARARAGTVDIRPEFSGRVFEGEAAAVIMLKAGDMARAAMKYALGR